MRTTIQNTAKYLLIKPIVLTRFMGTKVLKEQLALNGQVEKFHLIESFATFVDVIIHMCMNAKLYGARIEPNLYHIRVVSPLRNAHKEFFNFNELKIVACAKNKPYDLKQLEFELDEKGFDNYLQCEPIANICYRPKEKSWLKNVVNNILIDDQDLSFEKIVPKQSDGNSFQNLLSNAISQDFEPEYQLAFDSPMQNSGLYPVKKFSVVECSQSAGVEKNTSVLQSTTDLNRYNSTATYSESDDIGIVVDDISHEIQEVNITQNPKSKNKLNIKKVLTGIGAVGLLGLSMLPTFNIGNQVSKVTQTQNQQVSQVANKKEATIQDTKAKIKTYDNVVSSYIAQDAKICAQLQQMPKAINYGDNHWFAIDTSKHYLCQIAKIEKEANQLTGTDQENFKASNSANVTNYITKSKQWRNMST